MDKTIKIYLADDTTLTVEFDQDDYVKKEIMAASEMDLNFSLPYYKEIPLNSYVEFDGEKYYLLDMVQPKKNNSENFEYSLLLQNVIGKFKNWIVQHPEDKRVKFSYTAKPREILQFIIDICNSHLETGETAFELGDAIDCDEDVVSFDCTNVFDALTSIADTFETEWYLDGRKLYIKKESNTPSEMVTLQYGKNYNVKPTIERSNGDRAVDRLFVQGSSQNIYNTSVYDEGNYDASTLRMPKNATLYYDGYRFSSQPFDKARKYVTDAQGLSVYSERYEENTLHCDGAYSNDTIYPSRVGTVAKVTWGKSANDALSEEQSTYDEDTYHVNCNIYDNGIPDDLNDGDLWEGATISFQSGNLAGREFSIQKYRQNPDGTREILLVQATIDEVTMPNATFCPAEGDEYVALGIALPESYVTDAENRLFQEAIRYLYDIEYEQVTFILPVVSLWFRQNEITIDKGDNVLFQDENFAPNGLTIRTQMVKQMLRNKYEMELTLSSCKTKQRLRDDLTSLHIEAGISTETAIDARAVTTEARRGNQCFTGIPNPPYTIGDVYSLINSSNVIYKQYECIRTRLRGSYNASDWQERLTYYDDLQDRPIINGLTLTGTLQFPTPTQINNIVSDVQNKIEQINKNVRGISCSIASFNTALQNMFQAVADASSLATLQNAIIDNMETLDYEVQDVPSCPVKKEIADVDVQKNPIPVIEIINTTEK